MKNIHLNDIPMNMFMEYFNKTDLRPTEFTPKYVTPTIYEFNFTIGGTGSYYYRSTLKNTDDTFTSLISELNLYFADFGGASNYVLIAAPVHVGSLYFNNELNFVMPYQYRFVNDTVPPLADDWNHFVAVDTVLSKTVPTNFVMNDLRDRADLFAGATLTAEWDPIFARWEIDNVSAVLVGYIYENRIFEIQDTNSSGQSIYLDDYGRETTRAFVEGPFTRHNQTLREVYNSITDLSVDFATNGFRPEVIGMIDSGIYRRQTLSYYEEYEKTIRYTRLASGTVDDYEYIDRKLLEDIPEIYGGTPVYYEAGVTNANTKENITYKYPVQTVLDLSNIRKVRVLDHETHWVELNVVFGTVGTIDPVPAVEGEYFLNTATGILKLGNSIPAWDTVTRIYFYDTVGNDLYLNNVAIPEWANMTPLITAPEPATLTNIGDYWIDTTNKKLYQSKYFSYTAIDTDYFDSEDEVMLLDVYDRAVTLFGVEKLLTGNTYNDNQYYFEIEKIGKREYIKLAVSGGSPQNIFILNTYDKSGKNRPIWSGTNDDGERIFKINGVEYPIAAGEGSGNFFYGSINIPAVYTYTYKATMFGISNNINQKSIKDFILSVYVPPLKSTFPRLDIADYTETTIIRDIYDSRIYVKREEIFKKIDPTHSFTYDQFVVNRHTVSPTFEVAILEQINTPISIEELTENFKYDQYIMQGYPTSDLTSVRGDFIPENVVRNRRLKTIKELASSFMEKRYDDFLFYDSNMIFAEDSLMNMRIFAEGYIKTLEKDPNLYELTKASKPIVPYTMIEPRIIIGNIVIETSPINTKTYTKSIPYILDKLSRENIFTKLLDYEKFPSDEARKLHLAEESKRLKAYSDFTKSTRALDVPEVFVKEYKRQLPSKRDFKDFIAYSLIQNFYRFSEYNPAEKNEFILNYENFFKDKIPEITENYTDELNNNVPEKNVYRKLDVDLTTDVNTILNKILIDDWSVL